jgi:hypothetical protein
MAPKRRKYPVRLSEIQQKIMENRGKIFRDRGFSKIDLPSVVM